MLDLLKASVRREYSGVSNANLLLIVGAGVYFLMPADLVPDIVAGLGFADDAAVIAYVVSAVRDELARFKASAAGRPQQLVANPVPTGNATLTWGLWVAAGIAVAAVVVAALWFLG